VAFGLLLQGLDDDGLVDPLGASDGIDDGVQGSHTQGSVLGDRNAMVSRRVRLEDHVASSLVDAAVAKALTEVANELGPGDVAGHLYAVASTSSRTRCSRSVRGFG
jgi:hypothetical protein